MKKALLRFATIPANKTRKSGNLELMIPLSPSSEDTPEIVISNGTQFKPINEDEHLFKIVNVMTFRIPIYSDYLILNKDSYQEFFHVEMNKDHPVELLVSPICSSDSIRLKPIKIIGQ